MLKEILKEKKKERNWNTQQLADAANLPVDTVNKIMSGSTRNPSTDTLMRLAKALDCSLGELLGDATAKTTKNIEEDTDVHTAITMIREIYDSRIHDLQHTITKHEDRERQLRKEQYVMLFFIFALVAVIVYLIIDALHGNWGFFQYQEALRAMIPSGVAGSDSFTLPL